MREIRLSGAEGGGFEYNRFPLPLSSKLGHYPNVGRWQFIRTRAPHGIFRNGQL